MAAAAADYNHGAYRPYAAPFPADQERPYRNEVVPYGDRRIDVVVKPPTTTRSPPPPLPVTKAGGGGMGSAWCFSDPEMKRRRRVASYKAYSVEGKVKASLRRGFRWIKAKCSELIHGCTSMGQIFGESPTEPGILVEFGSDGTRHKPTTMCKEMY
uniref:DUF3511 domain-containing protein n=1 Tax=Leersia perrieri TaxID=77586 RepID=A0A0D9VT39_9ORYZ